jgi:hypothetical protein
VVIGYSLSNAAERWEPAWSRWPLPRPASNVAAVCSCCRVEESPASRRPVYTGRAEEKGRRGQPGLLSGLNPRSTLLQPEVKLRHQQAPAGQARPGTGPLRIRTSAFAQSFPRRKPPLTPLAGHPSARSARFLRAVCRRGRPSPNSTAVHDRTPKLNSRDGKIQPGSGPSAWDEGHQD